MATSPVPQGHLPPAFWEAREGEQLDSLPALPESPSVPDVRLPAMLIQGTLRGAETLAFRNRQTRV